MCTEAELTFLLLGKQVKREFTKCGPGNTQGNYALIAGVSAPDLLSEIRVYLAKGGRNPLTQL